MRTCPMCGSSDWKVKNDGTVGCLSCGTTSDSISIWNHRTPEPGTSVIRWTMYNGIMNNLPECNTEIFVLCKSGRKFFGVAGYVLDQYVWGENNDHPEIGDKWAYFPFKEWRRFICLSGNIIRFNDEKDK